MKKDNAPRRIDENSLLKFLQKTKEGKYAKIEQSSLPFVRLREQGELVEVSEESFYYSVS